MRGTARTVPLVVIEVKLPPTYSHVPSTSSARAYGRALVPVMARLACHVVSTAPVVAFSATSPAVLATPSTLVNWPATNRRSPTRARSQTVPLKVGRKPLRHAPVEASKAARYDCDSSGAPEPCCTLANLPPTNTVLVGACSAKASTGASTSGSLSPTFSTPTTPEGSTSGRSVTNGVSATAGSPVSGTVEPGNALLANFGRMKTCVNGSGLDWLLLPDHRYVLALFWPVMPPP